MTEKVKDLSKHIVEECARRGLTLKEVRFLEMQLKLDLGNAIGEKESKLTFTLH